jgi:hypothetical protein
MKCKVIGWAVLLSVILLGAQAALGDHDKQPAWIEVFGGLDESWNFWPLTDENLVPLEDGDALMALWAGPNAAIDPPVRAVGSPFNGQPTGDDVGLLISTGGAIEYSYFYFTLTTWNIGDTDSLDRQRHPAKGEKLYVRVFNDDDLRDATAYGDSEIHEVIYMFQEVLFAVMPNDPVGPTTDQVIYGKYFKVIGGINPGTGQTFKLRDPSADLEDGDLAQLIWVGSDGEIDDPDLITRMPADDDVLIGEWGVNEGMWPSTGTGTFRRSTATYDDQGNGLPAEGDNVYVRLINSDNILSATHYGDSPIHTVAYTIGESLSVFTDDAVDCDTEFPPSDVRDFTIHGGWDPVRDSYYPLVDAFGLRLKDGDMLHLIWAGPDGLVDELDEMTGMPTGDDSLMTAYGIGEGISGTGTGRFMIDLFTFETHKKGGFPAMGDVLYFRVFDAPTIGEDSEAMWYGESETHEVQWDFNEAWYSFPDSTFDATTRVPWYRTIKIYGGSDSTMAEHPLTDSLGVMLEDGDLVQLIYAGTDGEIDPPNDGDCMPSDDDELLATLAVGEGYAADTGLFKTEIQTFSASAGSAPTAGDIIYVRVFNDPNGQGATHYGDSETHVVAYEQGEAFYCFPDDGDDTILRNPCYTAVEEWTSPTVSLPTVYALFQNYPNPFNPETDIQYQIPEDSWVELIVYNVLGQEICTLVDGHREAGKYTVRWFGTDNAGKALSSGIYFYRLKAGNYTDVRKMVLMK